jgi:hypothetical protein
VGADRMIEAFESDIAEIFETKKFSVAQFRNYV